jgi:Protein of unknown function (DUF3147)
VSQRTDERTWREPPEDGVALQLGKLRDVRPRDVAVRFLLGAVTSVAAGVVSLWLGPRAGGLFLAFPAILAASLTLIADEESARRAREDARGAVLGAIALAGFAAVGVLAFTELDWGWALAAATLAWAALALAAYFALWRSSR